MSTQLSTRIDQHVPMPIFCELSKYKDFCTLLQKPLQVSVQDDVTP
jgi:hypothetical protein